MPQPEEKIFGIELLARELDRRRGEGRTVALANGLFDILHVGHLRYLEGASREADLLVVAVNSDLSARKLKGPARPVTPEEERAELVAGFSCVDYVTIFSDESVEGLQPEAIVEAPEIVVVVLVEHGGHGGSAAAPIAQRVLARWFEKRREAGAAIASAAVEAKLAAN